MSHSLKHIILLNGPPGSGKDYLTNKYIEIKNIGCITKFAQPIRNAAIATFQHLNDDNFDSNKSKPLFLENNTTLRDWMIKFGQNLMKPLLGNDVFGRLTFEFVQSLLHDHDVVFITDLGFYEEIAYFLDSSHYSDGNPHPQINITVIQLYREGCHFTNDSRNYISPNNLKQVNTLRWGYCSEFNREYVFDDENVKNLTGEDVMKYRPMRDNPRSYKNSAKLWIFCNDIPKVNHERDVGLDL